MLQMETLNNEKCLGFQITVEESGLRTFPIEEYE
jgi:hypothetical protein